MATKSFKFGTEAREKILDGVKILADSVTVTSKGQSFTKVHLTYAAGDLDLADRIEFAMKFLKMSCDNSANTGF